MLLDLSIQDERKSDARRGHQQQGVNHGGRSETPRGLQTLFEILNVDPNGAATNAPAR